jgi:hypothetical protein
VGGGLVFDRKVHIQRKVEAGLFIYSLYVLGTLFFAGMFTFSGRWRLGYSSIHSKFWAHFSLTGMCAGPKLLN